MNKQAASWILCVVVGGSSSGAEASASAADGPACRNAAAELTHDHAYLVGSADYVSPADGVQSGSTFRWLVDGEETATGAVPELLSLGLDGSLAGRGGEPPVRSEGVDYATGKWGSALVLHPEGALAFLREGNLDLSQGTVEMWVAMRADGDEPVYAERTHYLFHYRAPGGDTAAIAQAGDSGIMYAGGNVDGRWQSAYGSRASTRAWHVGEWHHLSYTFSTTGGFMRFYVDGVLTADSNERRYRLPSDAGDSVFVGGNAWGAAAHYLVDEVRIAGTVATDDEIAARSGRMGRPRANEVWLDTADLEVGDEVVFEYTPSAGGEKGDPCSSEPLVYPGIPLVRPNPPSTLLPPNTTEFAFAVESTENTVCAYAVGEPAAYDEMAVFDESAGGTAHRTVVRSIDPNPNVVNDVYVRCGAHPDYVMHLEYRSLSEVNPDYPRTGNLWGSWAFIRKGLPYAARIDLWLGAAFSPDDIRELRRLNPDIRILTSINAIEHKGLPDDYYLRDVNGKRIEVWPGSYRLNLTKDYVAEYQARVAYERIIDSELMFDGCFFDNVMTTQSWLTRDIYGNPVQLDANEDGIPDDPQEFDAAWKAGVFHEMEYFRKLMPHAIVSGHAMNIREPGIADIFNGISIGFWTADVIEGKRGYADLWDRYSAWLELAREPAVTMIESSPPDQIAYGYDYSPVKNIPPSTLEFARTYYPYARFGLAFTLLHDGVFAHEFGDTWHGNDWWFDELDFELGYPLGPAELVEVGEGPGENIIENGDFELAGGASWRLWANQSAGCEAAVTRDTTDAAVGNVSARIDITQTTGTDWHIHFAQYDRSLEGGAIYEMTFWAKSDVPREIGVSAQKGSPDWRGYGLNRRLAIVNEWKEYKVSFEATETTDESRIQFFLGATTGTVWLDDVRVYERGPDVYRREFDNGLVLLNASREVQEVNVSPGYERLIGEQAPRFETILDDVGPGFSTAGDWGRGDARQRGVEGDRPRSTTTGVRRATSCGAVMVRLSGICRFRRQTRTRSRHGGRRRRLRRAGAKV